jgi:hypothetical protein
MCPGLTASRAERIGGTSGLRCSMRLDGRERAQCQRAMSRCAVGTRCCGHCDEDIILTAHSAQQLAVLDPAPAATGNGVYGMTREFRSKAYG